MAGSCASVLDDLNTVRAHILDLGGENLENVWIQGFAKYFGNHTRETMQGLFELWQEILRQYERCMI